ncbi:MAG: dimethylsulfonioproprionate lyase family protein [Pseudomonadota bacterium]
MGQINFENPHAQTAEVFSALQSDYRQVLKSYRRAFRAIVDCGNDKVQVHCKLTINELDRLLQDSFTVVPERAKPLPVTRFLDACLRTASQGPFSRLAADLDEIINHLQWDWGYDEMPDHLKGAFAYTEIIGEQSQIKSHSMSVGLVLFAPGCAYPKHSHVGITESYLVLSGSVTQNDFGVFGPGSLLFNPPGREHTITVDTMAPALLAYSWTAEPGVLAANEMILSSE